MQRTNIFKWKLRFTLIAFAVFFTACSDKHETLTQLQTCVNHYQAESYQVAKQECQLAAAQGASKAQWLMAHLYRYDLLSEGQDQEVAFKWYLVAAGNGHVGAMREVGQAYMYEQGVAQDYQQAHSWLMKAAKNQDAEAEFYVGILFFEGMGRSKDIGSAINWFKRAAIKNHTMSINNLAWVFATSRNAAFNNPKKAKFWIAKLDEKLLEVPMFLDTKAAVMAADEKFELAIKLQNQAIAKLPAETSEQQLMEFQKHLDNYLQGKAWHE
jgi:TPR repeat protein